MNTHDQAAFEQWLEKFATDEERALPYEQQIINHVLWLCGINPDINLADMALTPEDREMPQ